MVSIGGDRATSADYEQANRQARRQSQKKPKKSQSSGGSDWGAPPPSLRRRDPAPAPRAPSPQPQRQSQYQVPTGLRDRTNPDLPARTKELVKEYAQQRTPYRSPYDQKTGVTGPTGLSPQGVKGPGRVDNYGGPPPDDKLMLPTAGKATAADDLLAPSGKFGAVKGRPDVITAIAEGKRPPPLSDSERALLKASGWKIPKAGKTVEMPDSSFEKGGKSDLINYKYRVSDRELSRILSIYNTPAALKAGYIPPKSGVVTDAAKTPLIDIDDDDESAALSWETYEKMTDQQKAAVDLNSVVITTRQDDLKNKIQLAGQPLTDYNNQVLKLFGPEGGSETIAPATVELFSKLNLDLAGTDLDEWLSTERLTDTTEMKNFKFSKSDMQELSKMTTEPEVPYAPQPLTGQDAYTQARSAGNLREVETAVAQAVHRLAGEELTKGASPQSFESLIFGQPEGAAPRIGFGTAETQWKDTNDAQWDEWFRNSFAALSQKDPAALLGLPKGTDVFGQQLTELAAVSENPREREQQFLDYIGNMTDLLAQYGNSDDVAVAEQVRKNAQLGG